MRASPRGRSRLHFATLPVAIPDFPPTIGADKPGGKGVAREYAAGASITVPHVIDGQDLIVPAKMAYVPPKDAGQGGPAASAFGGFGADRIAFLRPEWQPCLLDRS